MPNPPLFRKSTNVGAVSKTAVVEKLSPTLADALKGNPDLTVAGTSPAQPTERTSGNTPISAAGPFRKRTVRSREESVIATGIGAAGKGNVIGKAIGKVGDGPIIIDRPPFQIAPFTRRIVRPRDLLVLDFTFINLAIVPGEDGSPQLQRSRANDPAYIVVGFPPQHLLEQAFFEDDAHSEDPKNTSIPVNSRLAEPSRLVFRVPANAKPVPFSLDGLLAVCRDYELSVAATATPPDPKFMFPGGIDVSLADIRASSPSIVASVAKLRKSNRRTLAGRAAATQALAAAVFAESRNQWYAKRSPFARDVASAAEVSAVGNLLGKIQFLPKLAEPTERETAIEAPTRLILSPNSYGAWVHSTNPVESAQTGRVELWHTRLAVRTADGVTEADDFRRTVRAIWSPDVKEDPFASVPHPVPPVPFRAPLDQHDRHNIVHLSANHQLYIPNTRPSRRQKPLPIDVERLMLSSLGTWMNVRGAWTPPAPLDVEEWRNRSTLGRDHYVRVVYAGKLYPFGHRASLVKVTERKFHPDLKGNAAILRQRLFIIVREPYRLLGNTGDVVGGESIDRKMPIKAGRLTTLVTPSLDLPENGYCAVVPLVAGKNPKGQSIFWPYVGGQPFRFHLQLEDETGVKLDVTTPLFFVANDQLTAGTELIPMPLATQLADRYSNNAPFKPLRRINFSGQRVQFAATNKPGDTSFEVDAMEFMLHAVNGRLVPAMASSAVTVPTLKHLARSQTAPELKFPSLYLKGGFSTSGGNKNPGEVFLELLDANSTKLDLSKQGDRSGGFLTPNIAISGLSRSLGPVGGSLTNIAQSGLTPTDFFGNLGDLLPKLFGCIKITDILEFIGLGDLTKLPRFISENLTAAQGLIDDVQRIQGYLTTLQGQLAGLAGKATTLANACATLVTDLGALLSDPLNGTKRNDFKDAFTALANAAKDLRSSFGGLSVPDQVAFAKTQLDQLLAKFSVGLEQAAEIVAMADRIADSLEALNEQRIKFEWKPDIKSWPSSDPIFEVLSGGGLVIAVELAAQSGASKEPSLDVACRLQKFDLNLIAPETFLKLHFNKIEFTASSRSKPDVNVDFGGIEFVGVLSFVETLRSLIPLDGFSDPPALSITEEGIEASFSLGLPNIAIGVFSLSNLSLGAALTVPFLGQQPLSVRFNFCERSDPFRLTVWIFGGGGFFAVTVTPAGVQILEASFEFGAACSLDFGVASGSVSIMAGIYYKIEADNATLTGYFNLKGRVSVLGLITASLELLLELSYEFATGKCVGRATLTIEVEVLFFSASVEISCEKKFAGANGDPSFLQIMAPYTDPDSGDEVDPWPEYCEAFAA